MDGHEVAVFHPGDTTQRPDTESEPPGSGPKTSSQTFLGASSESVAGFSVSIGSMAAPARSSRAASRATSSRDGVYLLELMRYLALNPVRAGMVKRPEDYEWSSHRATAGYEPTPDWLRNEQTLAQFGADREQQQREYRRFVDAGAGIPRSSSENVVAQLFLGSSEWIAKMRSLIESKPRSTEHPSAQRYAARPKPARIVEVVAEVFETTPGDPFVARDRGALRRGLVRLLRVDVPPRRNRDGASSAQHEPRLGIDRAMRTRAQRRSPSSCTHRPLPRSAAQRARSYAYDPPAELSTQYA
jgi:hypothetical protein